MNTWVNKPEPDAAPPALPLQADRSLRVLRPQLTTELRSVIPKGSRVLHVACGTGDVLAALDPSFGVGVEADEAVRSKTAEEHASMTFYATCEMIPRQQTFDFVLISLEVGLMDDIQGILESLHPLCGHRTRVVVAFHNYLWAPVWRIHRAMGSVRHRPLSWLSLSDMQNLLSLSDFEVVTRARRVLLPLAIPGLTMLFNRVFARLPLVQHLCFIQIVIARVVPPRKADHLTCSIVVPCRNERGNIRPLLDRIPALPGRTQVVFVEGGSSDGTLEEIHRLAEAGSYPFDIEVVKQSGKGKANAAREGFARATNDLIMILDADLTVAPEQLVKFHRAAASGKADFLMGCRLVYPLGEGAMQFANVFGNKAFAITLSWIIGQPIKDALCGTKVFFRSDLDRLARSRALLHVDDPFGDFDLIFGAVHNHMLIKEIPVRYYGRQYGNTNIRRWSDGAVLLRLTLSAMRAFKFGGVERTPSA